MSALLAAARARLDPYPVHAWAIGLLAAAILLVPTRGAVPSLLMGLVTALGVLALLDRRWGPPLPPLLRPLAIGLAALLGWQALGLALRGISAEDGRALGSMLAIAMLLPVTAAALRRDPRALDRILVVLFAAGVGAALLSLALHAAAALRAHDVMAEFLGTRLVPFGRARHAILGAGGLAASFLAGIALWRHRALPRAWTGAGLVPIGLTLLLTHSRGPLIALGLTLVLLALVTRLPQGARAAGALAAALLCFAVPVGLVIAEPWFLQGICRDGAFAVCRPAMRRDTWEVILPLLVERPLFGWGPSYRLGADTVGHAHNGVLGSAFHYGLPVAAGLVAILVHALRRGAALPAGPTRDFALAGLFFAAGFVGSDLPNPFAFLSTHYLFLWLPVAAAVAAGATPGLSAGRTPPTGSPTAPR